MEEKKYCVGIFLDVAQALKFNTSKSAKVTFSLRSKALLPVTINGEIVLQFDTKYLSMHLDSKLNWSIHKNMRRGQMRERMRNLY